MESPAAEKPYTENWPPTRVFQGEKGSCTEAYKSVDRGIFYSVACVPRAPTHQFGDSIRDETAVFQPRHVFCPNGLYDASKGRVSAESSVTAVLAEDVLTPLRIDPIVRGIQPGIGRD